MKRPTVRPHDEQRYDGQKILVLGAGATGISVVRHLGRLGARLRVADTRREPPGADTLRELGAELICGPFTDDLLGDAELVVASPGVAVAGPACDPAVARAVAAGRPFVGDVELFARAQNGITGKRANVIGITGTNGKSTVTAMAGALCAAAGLDTVVAGNIGTPVLDALHAREADREQGQPDVYVLELSSFQLETTHTLRLDAATMLNLTQDHLDRYASMDDYAVAKVRIFRHAVRQVLNRDDARSLAMRRPDGDAVDFGLQAPPSPDSFGLADGWLMRGGAPLLAVDDLPIAGLHNAANALAALALVEGIGMAPAQATDGLRGFQGLPHRCVRVAAVNGVTFFDDSKGTNVAATAATLAGMTQPVVLIAGGVGKEQDFHALAAPVRAHARAVVLIGQAAGEMAAALAGSGVPLARAASMEEAVGCAFEHATAGDAVLLSPACASFDMFRHYAHRGEAFATAVHALQTRVEANRV